MNRFDLKYFVLDGYEVTSYYSSEDEAFIAEIASLVGCATEGATREGSLDSLRAMKSEWISQVAAMGVAIPAPRFEPGAILA